MSEENANTTTITGSESKNVDANDTSTNTNVNTSSNVNAIESTMDTSDNAASVASVATSVTPAPVPDAIKFTGTGAGTDTGVDIHVDVEAAKMKSNNGIEIKTTTTGNNMLKNSADSKTIGNGENSNNISNKLSEKPTTPTTTTTTIKTTTITPALSLPMKQQEQPVMDNDILQSDESRTNKDKMDNDGALINFRMLYIVTQLCGVTMIILVGSWIGIHMNGLAGTSNPRIEFNWHPLLMTIGLIFLYGNSILVYRGFRTTPKKTLKIAHASVHMVAFILVVIALKTVFDSHNLVEKPIPNMYSLHSWLGLSAVLIFCMQYVCGFMAYMVPGLKEQYKIAYMPLHIYFGLFGFVLAIASALMGFTEKAIFSIPDYSSLSNSGVMVNLCGVLFVIFGGLVVYLTTEASYKRKPLPEDTVLLTGANE